MFSAGFSWWSCDCLICVAGLIAHVWGTALPGWTVLQVSWVFKSRSFHFLVVSKSLTEHKSWGEMMQRVTFTFHFRYSFCFLKISLIHFACFIYLLVYFKSGFPQWHSISSSTSHKPQNRPSGFVSFTSRWNLNKHLMDFSKLPVSVSGFISATCLLSLVHDIRVEISVCLNILPSP